MRALRSQGGVVPFPGADGVLAAVGYEAVLDGLRNIDDFGGSAGQDEVAEIDKHVAALKEPRHRKVRRVINSVVAFHKSQRIGSYLQEFVDSLLDAMLAEARIAGPAGVDLTVHLAQPVPPTAMARLMGFPTEDAQLYYKWAQDGGNRYQEAAAKGKSLAIADANPEGSRYVDERIAERMTLPEDEWPQDALTRFLLTEVDGERLEHRNIRAQILFMIGAGTDTTRNLIGSLFYRLGRDSQAYAALRDDPSLVDAAIEEALRVDAPAQFMVRTCQRPAELGGVKLEPGRRVFMCIGSANHDGERFEDPDRFRLGRTTSDHLAFGAGPHVCAGAALARLEMRTVLRTFLDRVEAFHLVHPDRYDPRPSAMLQGPNRMQIVIDATVDMSRTTGR